MSKTEPRPAATVIRRWATAGVTKAGAAKANEAKANGAKTSTVKAGAAKSGVTQARATRAGVPKTGVGNGGTLAANAGAAGERAANTAARSELVVRIVDETESAALNERYRGRTGATNVLAFPAEFDLALPEGERRPLGDVVVCAPVVAREAEEQGKTLEAHFAHIVIHGVLHLLGYDHEAAADAQRMENRERGILASLGFGDPYLPQQPCAPRARSAR